MDLLSSFVIAWLPVIILVFKWVWWSKIVLKISEKNHDFLVDLKLWFLLTIADDIFEFLVQFKEKNFYTEFAIVAISCSFSRQQFHLSSKEWKYEFITITHTCFNQAIMVKNYYPIC